MDDVPSESPYIPTVDDVMSTQVHWREIGLKQVLQSYADQFIVADRRIIRREWFVDVMRQEVVFKITTKPRDQ